MTYEKVREHRYQAKTLKFLGLVNKIILSYNVPLTVRQVHYRLVEAGISHPNDRHGYGKTSKLTTDGRYSGHIDWNRIVDDTRQLHCRSEWESVEDLLAHALDQYHTDWWVNSEYYIEIWCEKRTLRRMLQPVAEEYSVGLLAGAGWSSASAIWDAVERLRDIKDKKIKIIYIGDLDPSGDDMPRDVHDRLAEFGVDVDLKKLLVTESDLERYHLVKRFDPPKLKKDTCARKFIEKYGELFQVEVEAMDPNEVIRRLTEELDKYADKAEFERIKEQEQEDVEQIKNALKAGGIDLPEAP
jgi:hypothetical protein